MNLVQIGKSTLVLGMLGLLLALTAFTGVASARPHGITIECRDKHHHKVACPSKKHHHKKHHKKAKQTPEPKAEPSPTPAPTLAPPSTSPAPVTPPVAVGPSIMFTSITGLTKIPIGRSSPLEIGIYASEAGGVLTVDPEWGGVSLCGSSEPPKANLTVSVPAGASTQCVVIYALPSAEELEEMFVFETINLGTASEWAIQGLETERPIRA